MFKKICKICLFLFSIACFSQNTTFKAPDYKLIVHFEGHRATG